MAGYTPSTDVIREGYAFFLQSKIAGATFGQGLAEFDAWLAEHDRQVAERAWDEGARWAAVECAAIDDERQAWITPGDNPYRIKEEN